MSAIVWWFEHSLVLPFLGTGMRIDLFQSCDHCWVFQICCHTECNTLTASSFRVLSSSTGIPLHPLALLTAVLPKANLTSQCRMALGDRPHTIIVIWFIKIFFCTILLCVLSISSELTRSLPLLSFIVLIFGWNVPLIFPIFLKRSLVFPLLLFSSSFMHCSLKKGFLSLPAILCNSTFSWMHLSLSPLLFTSFFSSL